MRRASVTMVPEQTVPHYHAHFEKISAQLGYIEECLDRIAATLEAQALRPEVDTGIQVSVAPTTLSRNNRRFTRIWVANAQSVLISNITGGFAPFMLQAGWNYLDLVEGAQIQVQSGPSFPALYQCLDIIAGGANL